MSNAFHRSDEHFFHPKVMAERGFTDADEYADALITLHNEEVKPDDSVFFHGDLCMGNPAATLELISKMNGVKYLTPGNHDGPSATSTKGWKRGDPYNGVFRHVNHMMTIKFAGTRAILNHYPSHGDHTEEDRFVEYRPRPLPTTFVIHGHVHKEERFVGQNIHVGLDAWDLKPVNRDVLEQYARQYLRGLEA